jgi:NADH:ubiquinone reductase (H+-translocating)
MVVILGAGFAGVAVATELAALLRETEGTAQDGQERCGIVLIDLNNFSLFTPMLTEVVGGEVDPADIVAEVRSFSPRITFVQGRVDKIDPQTKSVMVSVGDETSDIPQMQRTLHADHLVIALGSITNFHHISGLEQHSLTIKTVEEAEAIRNRALMLFERADEEPDPHARRRLLTFVVGGGGFSGVETMGALNDLVRTLVHRTGSGHRHRYPGIDPADVRMVLVQPGPELLPEISPRLAAYARTKLEERGVEVVLNTRVTGAGVDYVEVEDMHTHHTRRIEAQTLVWAGGVKPSPVIGTAGLEIGHRHGVKVDACCAVPGHSAVWALGDCAEVPQSGGEKIYAPSAQNATSQGKQVARNIVAVMRDQQPQPFVYHPLGELAIVGKRSGVASLYGMHFSGWLAWTMWRAIYLAKLPRRSKQVRVGLDWLLDAMFGRDFAALPGAMSPGTLLRTRKLFDEWHVAVLLALYHLERAGRSPSNEEDLEEKLGYSDGAGFRRDRPQIEGAVNDFRHLDWIEIDRRDYMTLAPAGRHVATLLSSATPSTRSEP